MRWLYSRFKSVQIFGEPLIISLLSNSFCCVKTLNTFRYEIIHTSCIRFADSTSLIYSRISDFMYTLPFFLRCTSFPLSKLVKLLWPDTVGEWMIQKGDSTSLFCILFSSFPIPRHYHFFSSCDSFLYYILKHENIKNNIKVLSICIDI